MGSEGNAFERVSTAIGCDTEPSVGEATAVTGHATVLGRVTIGPESDSEPSCSEQSRACSR